LADRCDVTLLSGDHPRDEAALRNEVGANARLHFRQTPHQKMECIAELQRKGRRVMMVGDGLNDAGALKQADVGIAIAEDIGAFSPASDGILDAREFGRLPRFLAFARTARRIIIASFAISVLYNAVGITFAARGLLSPVLAAVLMPLSSISVVVFAVGATEWAARDLDQQVP
jgi:Cu+-exporting ATPase